MNASIHIREILTRLSKQNKKSVNPWLKLTRDCFIQTAL
jgi:hypothetical protein